MSKTELSKDEKIERLEQRIEDLEDQHDEEINISRRTALGGGALGLGALLGGGGALTQAGTAKAQVASTGTLKGINQIGTSDERVETLYVDEVDEVLSSGTLDGNLDFAGYNAQNVGALNAEESRTKSHPQIDVTHPDFGAVGDGVTDDYQAFRDALDAVPAEGATVKVPAGEYYLSQPLDVDISGEFVGVPDGQGGAVALQFADDTAGLIHSGGCDIRGFDIRGGGTDTTAHGYELQIKNRSASHLRTNGFGGHGFYLNGSDHNVNEWNLTHCRAGENGLDGFHATGPNANAGTGYHLDSRLNGGWAIQDDSFLGNTWISVQTVANSAGPYKSTDANSHCAWLGVYAESGQGPSELSQQDIILPNEHPDAINGSGIVSLEAGPNALSISKRLVKVNGTETANGVSRGFQISPDSTAANLDDAPSYTFRPDTASSGEYVGRYHVPSYSGTSFQQSGGGIAVKSSGGSAYDSTAVLYASDGNGTFEFLSCNDNGLIEFFAPDGSKTAELDTSGNLSVAGGVSENVTF